MPERNLAIRLSVMEGGKVKAELKEIGESGEKSLKKIELAGKTSSKGLLALNAAANDVKNMAVGLSGEIGPLGSALAAVGPAGLAAAAGIGAVALVLKKSFDEAALAEQAQNRLQGVLKATGYASGLTGKEIADMAEEMEGSTMTSAEAVKEASAIMATFRSVSGDTFKQAIHLAQDMSAVFGQDLRSSATQLGKALEDPIEGLTALRRVGVSFSDTQKDVIKNLVETGNKAEAQKLILAALEQQVGGAGQAETQGLTGAAHRLSVAWGDMLKAIGQTETVGGSAQSFLNTLASTFRTTIEWVSPAPLTIQLREAQTELAKTEKELEKIKDIPFILQPRGNVDKHIKKAEELRQKIEAITKALNEQNEEQTRAEAGRALAEKEGRADVLLTTRKGIDDALAKLVDDPSEKIAKINDELVKTKQRIEALREKDNSNGGDIDAAVKQAEELARRQIEAVQKPINEAAKKEAETNQKVIDDLKRQLIGLTDERQAFIDQAVSRLSDKADAGKVSQTRDLAGKLFDQKTFAEAQKILADLTRQLEQTTDKKKAFVDEYLSRLPKGATQDLIEQTKQLASATYDQVQAREKLDKLKEEGKQLTDSDKTATEGYADQIAKLNELLNAGAISQNIYNRAKSKAAEQLLAGRTDPQAGALRAFASYQKEAENTAGAVEKAFGEAMKATEDAIVNMVMSGKLSLSSLDDFANSIVADITRMFVQKSITGPLFKALSGSMESGGFLDSIMSALSFHEGGTVGETSARLMVPSYVFAGAPRYHGGGIAGLKSDEVPAILQRGEEVISRKDRKSRSAGVSVVMHITTPDANSFRASQNQISAEAARGINRARRNL
ncbi:MAG: phage tail tape measure C-terminal domain-containing protein [Alphaproteobacteria bacterium]|jgi:lambda family phage tail tape measure protein|nr:phage tail tape measure C-terminal domain-containing protein [Alphaproteobacteria bacterium]